MDRQLRNAGTFGPLLRRWRQVLRMSQLQLGIRANVSSRHISFLESGRARPSRDMVLSLGAALDLPLAERNGLHVAAGFVPPYSATEALTSAQPFVRQALDFMLRQQEPYPAIVIDGRWDIRQRNGAANHMFAPFRQSYDIPADLAANAMHTVFHPGGLRQFMVNWREFAGEMLLILQREVAQGSAIAQTLHDEISRYPDFGVCANRASETPTSSPVMTMRLRKDDYQLAFISTFTTFAMPADASLQQLKVECFYPADAATAAIAQQLAATHHGD